MLPTVKDPTVTARDAKSHGLPQVDGKQAVALAKAGEVYWYRLEDGSEVVRDRDGLPAEWPA